MMDASIVAQEPECNKNLEATYTTSFIKNKQLKINNRYTRIKNHEISMQNKFLVKNILEIQQRKQHYPDVLESTKEGKNVYHIVGHSRTKV
jgi:hypothetical protein